MARTAKRISNKEGAGSLNLLETPAPFCLAEVERELKTHRKKTETP
nr:MAG TPA: hypothetical protein [Caudoviricetes sp.]